MASLQPAALLLDGGDPRKSLVDDRDIASGTVELQSAERRKVGFEEYMYYAAITRAEERVANERYLAARVDRGHRSLKNMTIGKFSKKQTEHASSAEAVNPPDRSEGEKDSAIAPEPVDSVSRYGVTSEQQYHASRAIRTASWTAIFYLITTDILGPYNAPWAFAQLGYGPGIALYTVFGGTSAYSGWLLWKIFLSLDSDRYPLRGYGDFFFRLFGPWAKHFVNIGQSLQLLLTVSVLVLSNGQSISQISRGEAGATLGICFVACLIIFAAAGLVLGQIRTLRQLGWFANAAVWINLVTLLLILASVGYGPNYAAVEASYGLPPDEPIQKFAGIPPSGFATGGEGFVGSLNGINNAVYAYGGALLFAALLAEMRHPMDFWKSLVIAETFIYVVYIFFGVFMYSFQGQYAYNPAVQGIAKYSIQTGANVLSLITGLIAAVLYGNIGLKVVYTEVFHELLRFPPLTTKKGKVWWSVLIPVYWAIAFIIAAAVPQFASIVGLVGALFILSFTYTFPAWLAVGFWIKRDAMIEGEERFDPQTNTYNYVDSGWKRWMRGFMKRPLFNTWNIIYFLGALTTTALGTYSSIESLRAAFASGVATSLTCEPPL